MTEKTFRKDEIIFHEGDVGETLYQITGGTVGIFAHYGDVVAHKLTELNKGQFFGEMAVIESYPRSATAMAIDEVSAVEISSGEIMDYFRSEPDKIIDIMKHMSARLRVLTNDYTDVSEAIEELHLDRDEKPAETLMEKIRKFADVYKLHKNASDIISVETKRKIAQASHSEGYTKGSESFSKGTVIFKQGETGDCMYDIHSGKVGIFRAYGTPDERCLAELGSNSFFGEMGLLEDDTRSATAVILENGTTLESIRIDDLKDLFENNPPKLEMIMAHMSYRLRKLTNEYLSACRLVFNIHDASASGSVSSELKQKAGDFKAKFYD